MNIFELKEEHIKLLQKSIVTWGDAEYGAPAIDPKRPYGNYLVKYDIASILGIELFEDSDGEKSFTEEQLEHCEKFHKETETALQIVLSTKSFEPGVYVSERYSSRWKKV